MPAYTFAKTHKVILSVFILFAIVHLGTGQGYAQVAGSTVSGTQTNRRSMLWSWTVREIFCGARPVRLTTQTGKACSSFLRSPLSPPRRPSQQVPRTDSTPELRTKFLTNYATAVAHFGCRIGCN